MGKLPLPKKCADRDCPLLEQSSAEHVQAGKVDASAIKEMTSVLTLIARYDWIVEGHVDRSFRFINVSGGWI
jgi:hypothetical protein